MTTLITAAKETKMVRAGKKVKYCIVGDLVCHIYFAPSIETLEK